MFDLINYVMSSDLLGILLALPVLGLMDWRIPGEPYLRGADIYDFSPNNPTGLGSHEMWTPADLMGLERVNWQRPDTSQQPNAASIQNYLNNEATMRQVFGLNGNSSGIGAGPGIGNSPGATSANLQPNQIPMQGVNSQLSTANLTLPQASGLAPNAMGTLPVSSGLSTATANGGLALGGAGGAAAGGGAGAAAPAISGKAGAASWFSKIMGNQRLLSGVLSTVGTWYGQYDQKKQAQDIYKAQQRELDARRAYEQQRIEAYRNSPAARMAPELMKLALGIYGKRLNQHGVKVDPNAWINMLFGGGA